MEPQNEILGSLFLNTLPVGVCIIKEDYTISTWNRTLENWTGIQADEILEKNLVDILPAFSDPLIRDRVKVIFCGGGPVIFSSRFHQRIFPLASEAQSEGRTQRVSISPFELPDGEPRAMIAVEDVTAITNQVLSYRLIKDQIKQELEEKKKTERALAIAISKLNTLGSITRHDLNNILTAFLGYLSFALEEKPGGKIELYLEKMKQAARVMKSQIAFAKDYQEMGNSLPTWFRIDTLMRSSTEGSGFSGITSNVDTGTLEVIADPLIEKAIYNLFENAVRHGEHTTAISVTSKKIEDDILIIIQDNGKGVPIQNKNRIFDRGFGSNTGLGLFLVREILGITGMQIIETGVEGKGARFEIRVPAGQFRYQG
ncbi:MAG TPA: ATP-binding protein [Methanospirillum sp.]|nr:ATP-binding protein [Methanospirillum sp.]